MGLPIRAIVLAAALLFSSLSSITASPLDYSDTLAITDDALIFKRQAVDPSNIAPEDETDAEIAADGTGPLRSGMDIQP